MSWLQTRYVLVNLSFFHVILLVELLLNHVIYPYLFRFWIYFNRYMYVMYIYMYTTRPNLNSESSKPCQPSKGHSEWFMHNYHARNIFRWIKLTSDNCWLEIIEFIAWQWFQNRWSFGVASGKVRSRGVISRQIDSGQCQIQRNQTRYISNSIIYALDKIDIFWPQMTSDETKWLQVMLNQTLFSLLWSYLLD